MKNVDKVNPRVEIELGEEKLTLILDFETIYNYELEAGRPLAAIFRDSIELASVRTVTDFLVAALKRHGAKYSKAYILSKMKPKTLLDIGNNVIPKLIAVAFLSSDEAEQEKKDEGATKTTTNPVKAIG